MGICADRRDYKNGYKKHLHAFRHWNETGSNISKRLILIYCVECGLKCLIMKNQGIQQVSAARSDIADELNSHDIAKMLKTLNQIGIYKFPPINTVHGDNVRLCTYHQLCRYCIQPINEHLSRITLYDTQLESIAEWISERV